VEESVGLGRFHEAGSPAVSDRGADRGADIQLVESVHQAGYPEPAYGSDDQPTRLLHGIGRPTTHGNQTTLTITSNHAPAEPIRRALAGVSRLLRRLIETAEQFKGQPTLAVASAVDFSRLAQKGCARSAISTADRLGQLPDLG